MNQPWRLPGKKVANKQAIQANQNETTGQVQQKGGLLHYSLSAIIENKLSL